MRTRQRNSSTRCGIPRSALLNYSQCFTQAVAPIIAGQNGCLESLMLSGCALLIDPKEASVALIFYLQKRLELLVILVCDFKT